MPYNYGVLRRATVEDVEHLAPRLRLIDRIEIEASNLGLLSALEILLQGLRVSSPHAWVLCDDETGEPYALGGVRSYMGGTVGIPWLVGTYALEERPLQFHREAKAMLARV